MPRFEKLLHTHWLLWYSTKHPQLKKKKNQSAQNRQTKMITLIKLLGYLSSAKQNTLAQIHIIFKTMEATIWQCLWAKWGFKCLALTNTWESNLCTELEAGNCTATYWEHHVRKSCFGPDFCILGIILKAYNLAWKVLITFNCSKPVKWILWRHNLGG